MKNNIKFFARFFEIVCIVLIPILVAMPIYTWFFGDKLLDSTYGFDLASFSFMKRLAFCFLGMISTAFISAGLILFIRISRLFQRGEFFSPATAELFARLSRGSLWWGLYTFVVNIACTQTLMIKWPMKLKIVNIGVSALFALFIFAFFSIVATLVSKATKLQDDQDSTV